MSKENLRISISFKNDEIDFKLYEYLQTKRDKSNFIKELIEKEMEKENKPTTNE